jgi:hypothetical protein
MIINRDQSLNPQDNYTLKEADPKKPEDKDDDTPIYMETLDLTKEQQERLLTEVKEELDEIKKEREELKLEQKWRALENQYEGQVEEDAIRQFNLCRRVTKVKCDAVERLVMKAFWKSDPKFSISPRPEFDRQGGRELCQAQEDFLDYKIDNTIPFDAPERQTVHSAAVKGTGIKKWFHEIRREKRRREEFYDGSKIKMIAGPDGQPVEINQGLIDFAKAYPDAQNQYPAFIKKIQSGKKVRLVAEYEETVYNDPLPTNVSLKNFYVRVGCAGYEGLKTQKLIVERLPSLTWWELKLRERQKRFYNIDELMYKDGDSKKDNKKKENYSNEKYDILECTYQFKLKETDEDEIKIIVWVAEDRWIVVGSILYPYYAIPCVYNPKYIATIRDGFYQPGIAEYLTDNNIAENAIINFTLEGALAANTITPIADRDNPVHAQFLDKRWAHGIPIETKEGKPIDFLNKYIGNFNHTQLLTMLEFLGRDDGEVTGINQLMTGQESRLDPTAPAAKTIALLQASGINIEDFIDNLLPSATRDADMILQLYYQMSEEGEKYAPKPERVVGSNPFSTLSRSDMIARTNIQSRAKSFNYDEITEKQEDLALFSTIRQEPIITRNPQAVYVLLKHLIRGWSKKWKNLVDQLLPPLEQFQQQQQQLIAQGVAQFLTQKLKEAQAAGQEGLTDEPPVIVQQLLAVISDLQGESMTLPPKEVVQEREKQAKEQGRA